MVQIEVYLYCKNKKLTKVMKKLNQINFFDLEIRLNYLSCYDSNLKIFCRLD